MITIKLSQLHEMATEILDEDTGMTALDYWEWSHPYDDIEIVDDVEED